MRKPTRRQQVITDPERLLEMWANYEPMTLAEVARCMGKSKEHIRQIEKSAMLKIRAAVERELGGKTKEMA